MGNPQTPTTLGTQDTGRKQTKVELKFNDNDLYIYIIYWG